MLSLQFQMSFGCLYLIGAELPDSATIKTWKAGEPSFVDSIKPGGDWRGTHCHVIEVDEFWDGLDGDTICRVEWLILNSLGNVPPLKFAGGGAGSNIHHVKFRSLVKSTI